ncbi:hypothetical protein [Nocardioides sp. TF02-7]|uniref:hypothetical protein n=1 Tax=Nocardioides sp. TF02-7 TaxID=2917724 RepID=UPI001F059C63|nr:hypothetical protein [Nocardioides sp. TF02-7]UMG93913.1 hypothetical protein MF408_07325 [Nocardioides sp. TF02-7]
MYRRAYTLLIGTAVVMWATSYAVALAYDRPFVEPEGKLLGPSLSWLLDLVGALPSDTTLLSLILLVDLGFRALSILAAALLVDLVVRAGWILLRGAFLRARGRAEESPGAFPPAGEGTGGRRTGRGSG